MGVTMSDTALMRVEGVACGRDGRPILTDVSLTLHPGEVLCLLGPNGVGKTTLFKTLLRLLPPLAGRILIGGEDTETWSVRRFARHVGYVPQVHTQPFPFTLRDVAAMGRTARFGAFAAPGRADMAAADAALDSLGIAHLAERPYTAVSGGERQLALIARALAQDTRMLVLDEPTANLDFGNRFAVLEQAAGLAGRHGLGVLMTTHDPNEALRFGTRAATIDRHGSLRFGHPAEVVTESYLAEVYGVRSCIVPVPGDGNGRVCVALRQEEASPCV